MIKALICGISGKMGASVCEVIAADDSIQVACGVDILPLKNAKVPVYATFNGVLEDVDVIIDFSAPSALHAELEWAKSKYIPVVLATTGYSKQDLEHIGACAKEIAIFKTANFSVGVNLIVQLVQTACKALGEGFDIEIVERHHRLKADAPSGTALMLADSANEAYGGGKEYVCGRNGLTEKRESEIGIHAVRGGTIVGEHEVIFAGEDEIVTISHSARSKKVFATGAVRAAKWIAGKPAGIYDMTDILNNL